MTEDEKYNRSNTICRFCGKNEESDKVRDHCYLTSKYRGSAHNKCDFDVTQKQSIFIPFAFHNFGKYDCHRFFKKFIDKKMIKWNLLFFLRQT